MAIQLSQAVRDAKLDAIETTIAASALLDIYDLAAGAPAACSDSITGTLLSHIVLPADWMAAASGGTKALARTWSDTDTTGSGTADFFRILNATTSDCGLQGTVSSSDGSGDMILDNPVIAPGQTVTITGFTLTEGNA